jgi:hypothetical protein
VRRDRAFDVIYLTLCILFGLNLVFFFTAGVIPGDWPRALSAAAGTAATGMGALLMRQVAEDRSWTVPIDAPIREAVHDALYTVSRHTSHHPVNHLLIEHVEEELLHHIHLCLKRGPDAPPP